MSSKVERERRKAQLLSQIQQQRLDLSASRREWLETTGAYDPSSGSSKPTFNARYCSPSRPEVRMLSELVSGMWL